jgi:glycosyltransferase involved in cell wall biosynthesis
MLFLISPPEVLRSYCIIARMDRKQYENVVISLTDMGALGRRIEALGVRVHTVGRQEERTTQTIAFGEMLYLLTIGMWRLVRLLKHERPQVLQTWLYHADLLGFVVGKLMDVPVILWNVRCTESSDRRDLAMTLLAQMSRYTDAVVVNSKAGRRYHETKGYHPKAWVHIPNGVDTELFRPDADARRRVRNEIGVGQDFLLIGLIGRHHPLKDIETFLVG